MLGVFFMVGQGSILLKLFTVIIDNYQLEY